MTKTDGCTELTCIYHGEANRAQMDARVERLEASARSLRARFDTDSGRPSE